MNKLAVINSGEFKSIKDLSDKQVILLSRSESRSRSLILDSFHNQTGVAYMGQTWDSLNEVLCDCDWMISNHIYIVQEGIPPLSAHELDTYLRILKAATRLHETGPRPDYKLPQRKIDFHVVFLAQDASEQERLLGQLADQDEWQ